MLDAVRGRNVTVKLKSESHPTITFNGKEMPVDLPSQRQYTLQELYDYTQAHPGELKMAARIGQRYGGPVERRDRRPEIL